MTTIFETGNATLYLGDCRAILPTLPRVPVMVTDPPYGIDREKSGHDVIKSFGGIVGDDEPFDPRHLVAFPATFRVLWGANHYHSRLPEGGKWLMWLKHDPRLFGARSTAPYELAWTDAPGADRAVKHIWDGSIKEGEEHGTKHLHPTQKPVAVMDWCLSEVTGQFGTECVIDPYMGSGTTGVAVVRRGWRFIGIEIDPVHFEVACQRLEAAQTPTGLFA